MKQPWRHVLADDTVVVGVAQARDLAAVPRGNSVALIDERMWARRRCRRRARSVHVDLEREYIVLPSLRRPLVVVEDDKTALRWLIDHQVTAPPGWPTAAGFALKAVRIVPLGIFGAFVPGRVVVGRRQ